ncbi:MAG: hypothetical protein QOK39_555 [Acidimicrobiaceae bacterium]|jgi:hypothetical protein|nr:hypothetical protein [Acidimicrobiaceae bacterium]
MDELPEDAIEVAEEATLPHSHDGVSSADGSLVEHLRAEHQLEAEPAMSAGTQEGLHDRLHHDSDAADD